jgi:anti-sigma-K factor RskA
VDARDLHDLTPAYALDALDADEAEDYEAHLAQCERCRAELAELSEGATALAWGGDGQAPPPELRERILAAAAAERANVVPLRPRSSRAFRAAAAAAVAAACFAVGFGVWAFSLHSRLGAHEQALSAVLVVRSDRAGTLRVAGLPAAPTGKTYEAWVIPHGVPPRPAGTFRGGSSPATVHLRAAVPPGATVAVTIEHAGGAAAPTTPPLFSAQA